jgi:hypothetical protein
VVNWLDKASVLEMVRRFGLDYDQFLIFKTVQHELNQICSRHSLQELYIDIFAELDDMLKLALQAGCELASARGLSIMAVRISKPTIPRAIQESYEKMEGEKSRLIVANLTQGVVRKEAETQSIKEEVEAGTRAKVSAIDSQEKVARQEAQRSMERIKDEAHLSHEKMLAEGAKFATETAADSTEYAAAAEARGNKAKLTKEYLAHAHSQAMATNSKVVYFGERIPTSLWQQGNL